MLTRQDCGSAVLDWELPLIDAAFSVRLADQYCHGVLRTEPASAPSRRTWAPPASGTTFFDTRTGLAVRRWCPPLLGLAPHCPPAHSPARRRELGVVEAGRRVRRGTGIATYLVDTGLPGDLAGPAELAAAGAAQACEIVRLELRGSRSRTPREALNPSS